MLFLSIFLSTNLLVGQNSLIKKTNYSQRKALIKSIETPKGKYLPKHKVDNFFNKKRASYVLVETKQKQDFFYGAPVPHQVTSIDYIAKRDLEGDKNYYLKQGIKYFKSDQGDKSLESFKTAIALGSHDLRAYLGMVQIDYQNDLEKYRQYLAMARQEGTKNLNPFWEKVYYHMNAINYNKLKQYSRALEYTKKVLQVSDVEHTSMNYSNVGYVYHNIGKISDYRNSISYLEKALEINPKRKEVLLNLGYSYFKTSQFAKAKSIFEKTSFLKTDKKYTYPINDLCNYYQGVCNLKLGHTEKALHQLNLFLGNQPKHGYTDEAYYFAGLAYIKLEENEKLRVAMINAAKLGNKKAIEFAAEYLEGTIWYNNRKRKEHDEMLAKALMPLLVWMIDDSIDQLFEENKGPTEEEWRSRGEAMQDAARARRRTHH